MYQESENYGNNYRACYLEGLKKLVEDRRSSAALSREQFAANIVKNREVYRKQYMDMLGWPLNVQPVPVRSVVETPVYQDADVEITRIQLEIFEGLLFYGILHRHKQEAPLPLVIAQHGGLGTPELCSSFFDSENYHDMTQRIFRKGVNVFAPQLNLWETGRFGPEGDRDNIDYQLKQLGGSITALEIYCIQRCMDYFAQKHWCDQTFGMVGLSYGGFYAMYTAAVDTRIKAALSCSHFNDRTKYNWPSKNFLNAANTFCDAEVAALVAPRYLAIEVGSNDELFSVESAKEEFSRLQKYILDWKSYFRYHIFEGTHEFCPEDDDAIDWMLAMLKRKDCE